jgi:hypothetical protein
MGMAVQRSEVVQSETIFVFTSSDNVCTRPEAHLAPKVMRTREGPQGILSPNFCSTAQCLSATKATKQRGGIPSLALCRCLCTRRVSVSRRQKVKDDPTLKCLFVLLFPLSAARRNPCKVIEALCRGYHRRGTLRLFTSPTVLRTPPSTLDFMNEPALLCNVVPLYAFGADHLISAHFQAHCRDYTTSEILLLLSSVLPQSSTNNCDHPTAPPPVLRRTTLTVHMQC